MKTDCQNVSVEKQHHEDEHRFARSSRHGKNHGPAPLSSTKIKDEMWDLEGRSGAWHLSRLRRRINVASTAKNRRLQGEKTSFDTIPYARRAWPLRVEARPSHRASSCSSSQGGKCMESYRQSSGKSLQNKPHKWIISPAIKIKSFYGSPVQKTEPNY